MSAQDNLSPDRSPRPYREVSKEDYPKRAADHNFVLDMSEPGFPILRGTCPRCGDFMIFPVLEDVYKAIWPKNQHGASAAQGADKSRDQIEPMICTCEKEHPGRPTEAEGCGAYWNLRLTFDPR